MSLTKGQITKIARRILASRNKEVWMQNNLAVRGRKFIGRKGVSDILGFTFNGLFMACEVKTINDSLKDDQISFLTNLHKAGGIALIATEDERGQVEIIKFIDYINT
jgi:hypothetical protein